MTLQVSRTDGYSNKLAEKLWNNRGNCTDFTIKVGTQSIPCHKIILISNSPVLEKTILSDMLEATTGEVHLDQFPYSIVEAVVTYMYTGSTKFSPDQLLDAVCITHFLELSDLHKLCIEHAPKILSPANVIQWMQLATLQKLPNIITSAKQLIGKAFNEISLEQQFLSLTLAEVRDMINAAKEGKAKNDELLKAVFHYISQAKEDRIKDLDVLIQPIDLQDCSSNTMTEIKDKYSEILTENPAFLMKFFKSMTVRYSEKEKMALKTCKSQPIIVLGFGREVWLLEENQFSEISKFPDKICNHLAACVIDQGLLVTGGYTSTNGYSNKVFLFIPSTRQWRQLRNIRTARRNHACVSYDDACYILGGVVSDKWSGNMEMLKVDTSQLENEQWQDAPQTPTSLQHPKASVLCGLIFLTGNNNTALYAFNFKTRAWGTRAQLPINPGVGYSTAAAREHLYLAGGNPNLCAVYSPMTDAWRVMAHNSTVAHIHGAMVMRGQMLVLIGGQCADVEQYDTESEVWSALDVKMPKKLSHHKAVIIEL